MRCSFTKARQELCVTAHGDQFEPEGMREQIVEVQNAVALFGAKISERQQTRESSPASAIARIDHDVGRIVGKYEPCTRVISQRQILLALGQMRAHNAGDRIAIAQAKSGKADTGGLHHQFFRMRGSAQEGEVRSGGKFEITHYASEPQAKVPCRNHAGAPAPCARSR